MVIKKDVQNQNDINVYIMNALNNTAKDLNYKELMEKIIMMKNR
jgi:hypothetical protein